MVEGLRQGWDIPSPRSDRLVPVTVPPTTQPTAAHAAASALALHWYSQEASVGPPPEPTNLVEVRLWVDVQGPGAGGAGRCGSGTKVCAWKYNARRRVYDQEHRSPGAHIIQAHAHTHYMSVVSVTPEVFQQRV